MLQKVTTFIYAKQKTMQKSFLLLMLSASLISSLPAQQKKEVGSLIMEGVPEVPAQLIERMSQYQSTRGASLSNWSPDGNGMLIVTRFGETVQLHKVDFPGGSRKQITFFKEPINGGSFCPDPAYKGFMFTKDSGGNEFSQLFWFNLTNGKYTMVSDGRRSQNSAPLWSTKGDRFISVSTRRNGKDYDLYLYNMSSPKDAKIILQQGGAWSPLDWSPDDKKLLVSNYISANKSFIHVLDIETGKLEQINPSAEDIAYGNTLWSADGKGIFLISDQGTEFQTLRYYDVATKKITDLTSSIPWDVDGAIMNMARNTIAFITNENGVSKLYIMNIATHKFSPAPGLPAGVIGSLRFHPNGRELGFTINTPQTPNDIYSINLTDNKLTRWTFSEVGGLDNSAFAIPELIEYPTFDQVNGKPRTIPAFYYKPKNASGKMPVVISIHGGPEGQTLATFNAFVSFLTNELGIAVVAPNVRGSTGYGKTFLKMDNGYKREESVKDIGGLIDWVAKQPELDASRIAVYGGSYGGYMVLASMTNFNDKIRCAIDLFGIANFVTFLQNTEDYRKDLRRVEYGDEREAQMKEFLLKISPANNVDKITKPMFIIQGLNDPRVPPSESELMKQKLTANGVKVWYMLAKDEGHGFRKKNNVDHMQWAIVMFLQENLIGQKITAGN